MIRFALAFLVVLAAPMVAVALPEAASAHVLVVQDAVTVRVNPDGSSVVDEEQILKALDASGARMLRTLTVPFDASRQSINVVNASILHPDESLSHIDQSSIRVSGIPSAEGAEAYKNAKQLVITFPEPTAGSVVAVHVTTEEKHPFLPGAFGFFHINPRSASLQEVRYSVIAPASLQLQVHANALKGGMERVGDKQKWVFTAEKLPAIVNAASQSALLAKSPYIEVSQTRSMDEVAERYLARVKPSEHVSLELQHLADSIGEDCVDPDNLMRLYYRWINEHVRLVDVPLGMGGAVPRRADDILLSGYGAVEDRVILLQALMKAKALPTDLVLVPTLPVTWAPELPLVPNFYNRLLLTARAGQQPLDIGNPVLAMGDYGPRDRNKLGVRIAPNGGVGSVEIPSNPVSQAISTVSTSITFDALGTMKGHAVVIDYGTLAAAAREDAVRMSPLELRRQLAAYAPKGTALSIDSMDSPLIPDSRFTTRGSFSTDSFIPVAGSYSMEVPRAITSLSALDNFARSRGEGLCQRTWREEDTTIRLGASDNVTLPKNVSSEAAGGMGRYTAQYALDSETGVVTIRRIVALRSNQASCDHAQQAALAKLAQTVRDDLAAKIIVKR